MLRFMLQRIYLMFGLVKFHIFSFFSHFFRFFRVIIKRYIRRLNASLSLLPAKINEYLIKTSGFSLGNVFDAFSVAALTLVLFKLFFRIGGINPSWQLNLSIIFVFSLISLKLNLIQFVRELFVIFWRKTLGERFYFIQPEIDVWDLVPYEEKFEREPQASKINKIFQNVHYFFIGLRLFILNEPKSFFFFNICLTYFLIFNKFFLFSSFFSLLLVFSRFTFFLFDHSPKELRTLLMKFVELEANESLALNMENIKFLSIFTTRFLQKETYDEYLVRIPQKGQDGKAIFDEIGMDQFLNNRLRERDIFGKQLYAFIYHSLYGFRDDMTQKEIDGYFYSMRGDMMFVKSRKDVLGFAKDRIELSQGDQEETPKFKQGREEAYKKLEEICKNFVKKQKINAYFYHVVNLSIFLILSYFIQTTLPIDYLVQTTIMLPFLKEDVISIIRVPANKIEWYRLRYLNKQSPLSSKSDSHDYIIVFTKYGQYLHTLTTIRDPDTPDLGKKVINEPYGIATTGTFFEQHLNNAEILKLQEEFGTVNKKILETLENSELIYIIPSSVKEIRTLLKQDDLNLKFFDATFNRIYLPNHMQIQHILLRDFRISAMGITGKESYNDLQEKNSLLRSYYGNQKDHRYANELQKKFSTHSLENLTKFEKEILPRFKNLDLPKENNCEFDQKKEIFKELLKETSKNQNKPYTRTETRALSQLLNKPEEVIKDDYSNLQNVAKNHGGRPLKIKGSGDFSQE